MSLYCYADQTIESEIFLGELSVAASDLPLNSSFVVHRLKAPPPELAKLEWAHQEEPGSDQPYQSMACLEDKFILRYSNHADFVISKDGHQVDVWSHPNTTDETICHLLLDQVLPRVLDHQGQLVVHAGAVRVGNSAIAFIGETGAGKSTLTANFHINGYPLLSDDGLLIKPSTTGATALATYPSLRLWPDTLSGLYTDKPPVAPVAHYSDKLRVVMEDSEATRTAPLPLAAIYLLTPVEEPALETISTTHLGPVEACMTIISNSFQLDASDKTRTAKRLNEAAILSQSVYVFQLNYARDFSTLPAIRTVILKHVEHCSNFPKNDYARPITL